MDLQRFYRNLRLKAHFSDATHTENPRSPVNHVNQTHPINLKNLGLRNKSTYMPPKNSHAVETFVSLVERDVTQFRHNINTNRMHASNNLSSTDKTALLHLMSNREIIIKPADKGGAVVIQDKNKYINEILSQLSDTTIYHKLERNPTGRITTAIQKTLDKYNTLGIIDWDVRTFLTKINPITPVIYTLPKIHKNLTNPPGRPIVASSDSILSPLSILLEKILTPLVKTTPSFLLDTSEFLKLIKDIHKIDPGTIFATFDVNSLYTSIKHELGIRAVQKLLESHEYPQLEIEFIIDLLKLVLTENFFMFQDNYYIQRQGTAMGSNVAPPYANTYMADFEETFIYHNPLFIQHCQIWKRYIDDVFCIWRGPENSLLEFLTYLNSNRPELQFTIHHDLTKIQFLDTLVIKKEDGTLWSDIYTKPTDRNNLLHFSSYHPESTKRSLPFSQYNRVERIVSKPELVDTRLEEMKTKFVNRGYPHNTLDQYKSRQPRQQRHKQPRIPFVHSYHPFAYKIHQSIRKHWPILHKGHPSVTEFQQPFLPCFKRPPNLKDKLVKADIGTTSKISRQSFLRTPKRGTFPCLHCAQCTNIQRGDSFTHPLSGKRYSIRGYYTCDTDYCVYLIKCPCGLAYIGETTQRIRDRICKHKSTIRLNNTLLPIPAHFLEARHSINQLKFQIIEHVEMPRRGGDRVGLLKKRESYWIHTLQTLQPDGLNRDYNIQSFC
ncbi:uncharacterized protein [Engystomops pustulosus]|uniref:uncharacterized protein n=1 Tax=Engystomops pustulosus TaxID=76066 RepID=UPI003AFB4B55